MNAPLHSCVYDGWVRHRRRQPRAHEFRYRLFMLYLDLDELHRVFAGRWLWSVDRRNLAQFRRADYHGDPAIPLPQAVRDTVQRLGGERPTGPIRLLTHLRYFGHCFNPVSFYYCFEEDGEHLRCILAEITNTPWKERHAYLLPVDTAARHGSALAWDFDKTFHVSPFMPMDCRYDWRFQLPDEALRVHMNVCHGDAPAFDATLAMQRRPLDGRSLAACLLRHPLMTLRIIVAIHWQALLTWRKQTPVYDHPSKSRRPPS
ncbi:MAG: DUF1365 domain-containing protein [Lysobacteraceae bacterium]